MPASFVSRQGNEVRCPLLTAPRTFRTCERRMGTPQRVGWHQVEYPTCPMVVRGVHVAGPPSVWAEV